MPITDRETRSYETHPAIMKIAALFSILVTLLICAGCTSKQHTPTATEVASAQELFDQTTRDYHLPSADAQGAAKEKLLQQAAAGYESLLRKYPKSMPWAAQSLRSIGNVRAEQGKLDEAVKVYASVESRYPKADWEILQSWKSAADLLWDSNRHPEAKQFYQKLVARFDTPSASAVIKTIVRASQNRLTRSAS